MDGLNLLGRARAAGLSVYEADGLLVIEGPDSLELLAQNLLDAKAQVLLALDIECLLSLRAPVPELALKTCSELFQLASSDVMEFAESRWGSEATGWSAQMLAGFYVRDLLAGLEAVLPWDGWTEVRARLDRQTGPTTIARLWSVFVLLPPETRAEVAAAGDRTLSPPSCLAVQADGPRSGGDR